MKLQRSTLFAMTTLLMLAATTADSAPVILDFEGTATFASGIFAGQGGFVSGSMHFDDDLVDSANADPNRDEFRMSAGANQAFEMFMTIEVGNAMWTTEDNADPPFTLKSIQQFDGPSADLWLFDIPPDPTFTGESEARIELRSNGASDALLPGSGGLTGMVLIPVLENFDQATGIFVARATTNTIVGQVNFTVDMLSVPESGFSVTTFVGVAMLAGIARVRRRAAERSLKA